MSVTLASFLAETASSGLEKTIRRFYGIYRAFVIRNDDDEERGRIQIACPSVGHDPKIGVPVWLSPAFAGAGDRTGWFDPPLKGSVVWVNFDLGDPAKPKVYWGGWHTKEDGAFARAADFRYADKKPQRRGFRSRAGHLLLFDDEPGSETVRLLWHKIQKGDPALTDPDVVAKAIAGAGEASVLSFESDGSIQIINMDGAKIVLDVKNNQILAQDATGNLFIMDKSGVKMMDQAPGGASFVHLDGKGNVNVAAAKNINLAAPNVNLKSGGVFLSDGAVFSATVAEFLIAYLATHTHGTGVGPSSPPIVPPPPNIKSLSVKLK